MTDLQVPVATSPAVELADDLVRHRAATEHSWALWNGDMQYLERWDDVTAQGLHDETEALQVFADRAAATGALDDTDQLLLETVAYTARSMMIEQQWRCELQWVNPASGILSKIFTFLPRYPLLTEDDGARYLVKIDALPVFIDEWRAQIEAAAGEHRAPIELMVDGLIAIIDRHLTEPLSTGPLGAQPPPRELDEAAADAWRGQVHRAVDDGVTPALQRLRATLADVVRPVARPDEQPGLVHVPGGAELYEQLIWAHTTLDLSAADVHEVGLRQIASLEDEYRAVAGPLLGVDDIDDIYRRLRDDDSLRYQDADSIVADATVALEKAAGVMADWFGLLPAAPCVASAIEQGSLAFYSPPAINGSKPGTFFFNTAVPSMWGTFQLEAVTYHESIPGHHLQFAIAQEQRDLHPLLGRYFITAYGEGWGLYTERLADEMGLYSTPLDRVGMLAADSMRACRLVVDTGMHALGWSRDRAIAYMLDHSPMSELQVTNEIDRYIGHPGQAVSYMIGRLEIDRLRAEAKAALGDRFDIKRFHDVVLGSGSVTLPTLRRLVETWVADGG